MEDKNNKIKIWRPRFITQLWKLYYSILILAFPLLTLKKYNINNITTLFEYIKDGIKLIFIDSYKKCYYSIFADFIANYKKQIFITGIKPTM